MRSVRTFLVVFFCFFIGLLQVSYATAVAGEERWNYTMIDVADLQGVSRYRISTAAVVEVARSRLQTGELRYNYTIREAAGQVAGQEQLSFLDRTRPLIFYRDPLTHRLRADDEELTGLVNLTNGLTEMAPFKHKQIGDRWQQSISISKNPEFPPEEILCNFEIEGLSYAEYGSLVRIKYSSEEFTLRVAGDNKGMVKAKFSGFVTRDPVRDISIHTVWNFEIVKSGTNGKPDLFNHMMVSFMSDPESGKAIVPFTIYPDFNRMIGERIRLRNIVSDPEPPEWFFQALGFSKTSWTVTGVIAEKGLNPPIWLVPVVFIADSLIEETTGVSPIKEAAFYLVKAGDWAASKIWGLTGLEVQRMEDEEIRKKVDITVDLLKLIHPKTGITTIAKALAATPKMLKIINSLDKAEKVVKVAELTVKHMDITIKKIDNMIPAIKQAVSTTIKEHAIPTALDIGLHTIEVKAPIFGPLWPETALAPTLDKDKLSGLNQIAGQNIPISNYTFTQTMLGFFKEVPIGVSLADFFITYNGSQLGLPIPKNFSGNMSGQIVFDPGVGALNLPNSPTTLTATGTISGKIGQTLKGTMNISATFTHTPTFIEHATLSGQIQIKPDGSLSKLPGDFSGPFKSEDGTNIGHMTVNTLTQTPK